MTAVTTSTARQQALDWADEVRRRRLAVRDDLQDGSVDLAGVLDARRDDPALGTVRVLWVLESVPGARKVSTRRALDSMGVEHATPLASIDDELAGVLVRDFGHPSGAAS